MAGAKEPLIFVLLDGNPYRFKKTTSAEKHAMLAMIRGAPKKADGASGIDDDPASRAELAFKVFFYSCMDRGAMSEDEFLDNCESVEWVIARMGELNEHAMRGAPARPMEASPSGVIQNTPPMTTGSDSGPIGQPSSEEMATNSGS